METGEGVYISEKLAFRDRSRDAKKLDEGEILDGQLPTSEVPTKKEDVQKLYDDLSNIYDKVMNGKVSYRAPEAVAQYFHKHAQSQGLSKDIRILEMGAGTGLGGTELKNKYGYTRIDALDGSKEALNQAREKGTYGNIFQIFVEKDKPLPFLDNSYDAVMLVGAIFPNYVPIEVYHEIIRIVKKGGIIVNCLKEITLDTPECGGLPDLLSKLEAEEKITLLERAVPDVMFYESSGRRAVIYAHSVL